MLDLKEWLEKYKQDKHQWEHVDYVRTKPTDSNDTGVILCEIVRCKKCGKTKKCVVKH